MRFHLEAEKIQSRQKCQRWEVLLGAARLELPLGPDFSPLDRDALMDVLRRAGEGGSGGAVVNRLAEKSPQDAAARMRSLRHVLWLVKYGYLGVSSASG